VEALAASSRAAAAAQAAAADAAWELRWRGLRGKCPARGFDPRDVHGRSDPADPAALSDAGFRVLAGMLEVDPAARASAAQLLQAPWFSAACLPKPQRLDEASVSIARRGAEAAKRQRDKEKQQLAQEQLQLQVVHSVGGHFPGGLPPQATHHAAVMQAQALAAAQMRAQGAHMMPGGFPGGFPGFPGGGFPGGRGFPPGGSGLSSGGGQILGGWGLPQGMRPPAMPLALLAAMNGAAPQPAAAPGGALAAAQAQAVALAQARAKALSTSLQFAHAGGNGSAK
jgi:hypothetical protein